MARKKISEQCELKSWDDVNLYLCEIGEKERAIEYIKAKMQEDIDDLKLKADDETKKVNERIGHLAFQMKLFADEHSADFAGKKTKALTFGQVGYRKSTSAILPKDKAKIAEIIIALKARGMEKCIVTPPEKINKDILKTYPEDDVKAVGAKLKVKDGFWYEVDREKRNKEE